MACEVITVASIPEFEDVRTFLFCNDVGYNCEELVFDKCLISYSPKRDIIAICRGKKLVVLKSNDNTQFHIIWRGILEKCDDADISIVFCLPIPVAAPENKRPLKRSWTCLIIGFSDGFLNFYTETGRLLISQMLHPEPISQITCAALYKRSEYDLYVFHKSVICSILGFALVNTLRACRNQLERSEVEGNSVNEIIAPSLVHKKWSFSGNQKNIVACAIGCKTASNLLSYLHNQFVLNGNKIDYQRNVPQYSSIVACGMEPFLGFYRVYENTPTAMRANLSSVASMMATGVKNMMNHSILKWFSTPEDHLDDSIEVDAPEQIEYDSGFYDVGREGKSMILSSSGALCATTDNFHRVCVADVAKGIVFKLLKGYRDVDCAWISAQEGTEFGARAYFLVVHSMKSDFLDIWTMSGEEPISRIFVKKGAKLLKINAGMKGLIVKANALDDFCYVLEPNGDLKQIIAPFCCTLTGEGSAEMVDEYLLKKFLEKKGKRASSDLARSLKTIVGMKKATSALSSSTLTHARDFLHFLTIIIKKLSLDEVNEESKSNFYFFLQRLKKLTQLYLFLSEAQNVQVDESQNEDVSESIVRETCETLSITDKELDKFLSMVPEDRAKKVTFRFFQGKFATFLSCFDVTSEAIKLHPELDQNTLNFTSRLFCEGMMGGNCEMEDWVRKCDSCGIHAGCTMRLVFSFWLNKPLSITLHREILNLYRAIKCVYGLCLLRSENVDWAVIRDHLASCPSPLAAITAAIVCRSISSKLNCENVQTSSNILYGKDEEESERITEHLEWENVTRDACDWHILIGLLEDIAFLDTTLKNQPRRISNCYVIEYENSNVALSSILKRGKGAISELVAKWIAATGLSGEHLLALMERGTNPTDCQPKKSSLGIQECQMSLQVDPSYEAKPTRPEEKNILEVLESLSAVFPYSLNVNHLLLNLSWEFVLAWKKGLDDLRPLETAIHILKLLPSPHIKQGFCVMMWNNHLTSVCKSAVYLMNKVGKVPKDRLCRQDIGISECNMTKFLELWDEFAEVHIEAMRSMDFSEKPSLKFELIWDENALPSLTEVALKQKTPNRGSLLASSQYAQVSLFLAMFSQRMTRVFEILFDVNDFETLFGNVCIKRESHHLNEKLAPARVKFLQNILSAVINNVLRSSVDKNAQTSECADKLKQYVHWMGKIFTLTGEWGLSVDALRQYQICELYKNGYDRLAEEIIPSVNEREELGCSLLNLLGRRVNALLNHNTSFFSYFSPAVTTWVQSLNNDRADGMVEIQDTLQLALAVNNLIPEYGMYSNILNQMLYSLENMSARGETISK